MSGALGELDRLLARKLKTAEGRRKAAMFAETYCRDVSKEVSNLNSDGHRTMLLRISEILRAYADELDALKEYRGVVRIRDGMVPGPEHPCGLIMLEEAEEGSCTTSYYPLDHALIPFKGKKVKVSVVIEEMP